MPKRFEAIAAQIVAMVTDPAGAAVSEAALDVLANCLRYVEDTVVIRFRPLFLPHH